MFYVSCPDLAVSAGSTLHFLSSVFLDVKFSVKIKYDGKNLLHTITCTHYAYCWI